MHNPESYTVYRLGLVGLLMVVLAIGGFSKGRTLFPFVVDRSARPFGYWTIQCLVMAFAGFFIWYGFGALLFRAP